MTKEPSTVLSSDWAAFKRLLVEVESHYTRLLPENRHFLEEQDLDLRNAELSDFEASENGGASVHDFLTMEQ